MDRDKKEKRGGVGIGVGGISILAVFVVLCLTTLAALSLASAQADYKLAQKAATSAQEYYEADAAAERMVSQVVSAAAGSDWEATLVDRGCVVEKKEDSAFISFTVPVGDTRELHAQVCLALGPEGEPAGSWERTEWKTQAVFQPEIQETLQVLR